MLNYPKTSYLVPRYNPLGAFKNQSDDDLDLRSRSMIKVKISQKSVWVKKQTTGHISDANLPTDFILGTMVQPK